MMTEALTYGVNFYQGQGQPFHRVTEQVRAVSGDLNVRQSPVTMYDVNDIVGLPSEDPESMSQAIAVHAFGISYQCASELYGMYRSILQERTQLVEDPRVLMSNDDVAYESPDVVDAVVRCCEILLDPAPTFPTGINEWDVSNVQLAFSIGLQKITNAYAPDCLTGYEVFFSTVGSYVDSTDNFTSEFSALNGFPGVTPRLVPNNSPMGMDGQPLDMGNEYILLIPTEPGFLSLL